MAEYDEAAFNEDLNENMADDPYGTAIYLIVEALRAAEDNEAMNPHEGSVLEQIAAVIKDRDPVALQRSEDHYRILRENQAAVVHTPERPFNTNPADLNDRWRGAIVDLAAMSFADHPDDIQLARDLATFTDYAENEDGTSFHAVVSIDDQEVHVDMRMNRKEG